MTEHYYVTVVKNGKTVYSDGYTFDKYEEAELYAKKQAAKRQDDYVIFKSFATAKAVVPEIEVVKH